MLENNSGPEGWRVPWRHGARGLLEPIVMAAFSYSGVELAGLVTNETSQNHVLGELLEIGQEGHTAVQQQHSRRGNSTHPISALPRSDKMTVGAREAEENISTASNHSYQDHREPDIEDYKDLVRNLLVVEKQRWTRKRVSSNFKRLIWQTILVRLVHRPFMSSNF